MKKRILACVLVLLMAVSVFPFSAAAQGFTDVKADQYYYDAVQWAVQENITQGTSATKFSPTATCTRAQIVTFLWRAQGEAKPTDTQNPFRDVKSDAYYYTAVLWAVEQGITSGTSKTTFSPNQGCTRGQVAAFLWRSAGKPAAAGHNPFRDVTGGAYYYDAVLWAVDQGITQGTGKDTFSPNQTCTRAQIVTFLWRYANAEIVPDQISGHAGNKETVYSVTDLAVSGNAVTVTFNTNKKAVLKLAALDEKTERVITQANAETPEYGESVQMTLTLNGKLPEHFLLSAWLEDLSGAKLCEAYVSLRNTSAYAAFKAKDIHDFPGAVVINFDDDAETNFGVLADGVKVISVKKGVNLLTVLYGDDGAAAEYRIEKPDAQVTALAAQDIVLIPDTDGSLQMFRIQTVEKQSDGAVVLKPAEDGEMSDYYQYMDLEMTVGGASSVSEATVLSADGEVYAQPLSGSNPGKYQFRHRLDAKLADGLSMSGELSVQGQIKVDVELDNQFFELTVKNTATTTLSVRLEASNAFTSGGKKMNQITEIELGKVNIPTKVPGLAVQVRASAPVELTAAAGLTLSGSVTTVSGFVKNSKSGLQNIDEKESSFTLTGSGSVTLKLGPKLSIGVTFCDDAITCSIGAGFGFKVSATLAGSIPLHTTEASYHACDKCVEGKAEWYVNVGVSCKVHIIKNRLDWTPPDWKIINIIKPAEFDRSQEDQGRFFISLDNEKDSPFNGEIRFGYGKCTNRKYRVTVNLVDAEKNPVAENAITVLRSTGSEITRNSKAPFQIYCYNGSYTASGTVSDGGTAVSLKEQPFIVSGAAKDVTLTAAGKLSVTVLDKETKKPIPGASITLSASGKTEKSGVTDDKGQLVLESLDFGAYTLSAKADGFEPPEKISVIIPAGGTAKCEVSMKRNYYGLYAQIVRERETQWGKGSYVSGQGISGPNGTAIVKLLDMDGDGVDELILWTLRTTYQFDTNIEVWTYNGSEAVRLCSGKDEGTGGAYFRLFHVDNEWLLPIDTNGNSGSADLYGVKNGKWVMIHSVRHEETAGGDYRFLIDGKQVSQKEANRYIAFTAEAKGFFYTSWESKATVDKMLADTNAARIKLGLS